MTRERMASSLARAPALRITCASPSERPANLAGSKRASMQVRMAKRRAGGMASLLFSPKLVAYLELDSRTSLRILLMVCSFSETGCMLFAAGRIARVVCTNKKPTKRVRGLVRQVLEIKELAA